MSFNSKQYIKLNDIEWLHAQYVVNKLSTIEIAEIVGAKSCNSIRQALLGAGISLRTYSEGLRVNNYLIELDDEIINGSLLGDASLRKYNKSSNGSIPYFSKNNKHKDHVELIAKSFYGNSYSDHVYGGINKCRGRSFEYWRIRTPADERFTEYYCKWYPEENNYKKVVPPDLILTPRVILHWFMDDGSSYRRYRYAKHSNEIIIRFSSESFTQADNQYLVEQLNRYSLNADVERCNSGTGYRIKIAQIKSLDFFNLIGECPIESMKYKWKFHEKQYEKRPIDKIYP